MTWLDDERYAWIREHLLHRPGDRLLYRAMAAGRAEAAPTPTTLRELVQQGERAARNAEEEENWE